MVEEARDRTAAFFTAAATGDLETLRRLLAVEPGLVHARDAGDHATPLHFAAAGGHLEIVRLLLDAGADVHGDGDLHEGGVIGWAARRGNAAVMELLLARGARHHVFSALALGDVALVERLVADDPANLQRRRSRFEGGQTPLHMACAPPDGLAGTADHAMLARLLALGADVEARDDKGRTALQLALLRGDREAARLLEAAGATRPPAAAGPASGLAPFARHVRKGVPSVDVPDVAAALAWYTAIGFTERTRYEHDGVVSFGMVALGQAELAFGVGSGTLAGVSLWLYCERIDELYRALQQRQLAAMAADADAGTVEVGFEEDLYEPFYGGRQFGIRDLNGLRLIFYQPPT